MNKLAYLAGLLDAKGYFRLTQKQNKQGYWERNVRVRLTLQGPCSLYVLDLMGLLGKPTGIEGYICELKRSVKNFTLLENLLKYSVTKCNQIDHVLEAWHFMNRQSYIYNEEDIAHFQKIVQNGQKEVLVNQKLDWHWLAGYLDANNKIDRKGVARVTNTQVSKYLSENLNIKIGKHFGRDCLKIPINKFPKLKNKLIVLDQSNI